MPSIILRPRQTIALFSAFSGHQSGNISIISALVMLPLFFLLGGSLDVIRATVYEEKLHAAAQSAALAAASLTNAVDARTTVDEYLKANLAPDSPVAKTLKSSVTETRSLNTRRIEVIARAEIETYFMPLFGQNALAISASAEAFQSATNVEISLALDISSSMNGQKFKNLKTATKDFIDTVLDVEEEDRTTLSIVPFGGTVNIGSLFKTLAYKTTGSTDVDPDKKKYNGKVLNGKFRFSDGGDCIEYQKEDFSGSQIEDHSRSQVPHFWKWNNFNPWCPESFNASIFNSNNKEKLTDLIDDMTLSDGTGMDVGAMWAYKALSPAWQGKLGGDLKDRPAKYGDDVMKIMIIMSDGDITSQYRPKDWWRYNVHTNRSKNNPTSQGKGNSGNSKNQQTSLSRGNRNSSAGNNNAIGYFRQVCADAKADNIIVYTIGFQIKPGSIADDLLEDCASDASNYYLVESLEIGSAFSSIAASVNALRITG